MKLARRENGLPIPTSILPLSPKGICFAAKGRMSLALRENRLQRYSPLISASLITFAYLAISFCTNAAVCWRV